MPLATVQPKAIILTSIKLNLQLVIFYLQFWQGGMQQAAKTAISKVMHSSMQLQSKLLKCYIGTGAKISKTKTSETNCKVLPNLKYYSIINQT